MSGDQIEIVHQISADQNFDAEYLFVVVKNILKRAIHVVDNVLLGQEHMDQNPEEKVSRASLDPLLCTLIKQLSLEMACEDAGMLFAYKTRMSILDKLSSNPWNAKAVLTLAAFALNYEDFSTLAQLRSSHNLVESMEIPKHVPATLKHLDLQKDGKMIGELNKIINDTLDVMESLFELNALLINEDIKSTWSSYDKNDIREDVNQVIITLVACTTQIFCLTSNEDKTQDLLPLAHKISVTLKALKSRCQIEKEEKKAERKLKELLQTPNEIMEVFKGLIFARDDVQPLIDGSTNEMVSIDVLKTKNVLLFISSLEISNNDISILMPIYDGLRKKGDQYKIVWIPIVEQWTDDKRKKFEILRFKMPWYIVQYFSPIAGIKFIKEEWHFENRIGQTLTQCVTQIFSRIGQVGPILALSQCAAQIASNLTNKLLGIPILENKPLVVVMNPEGDVKNKNALDIIRQYEMEFFPFPRGRLYGIEASGMCMRPPGPYAIEEYTFLCGGKDNGWIEQFSKNVNVVAEDPIIKEAYISIELSCIGKAGCKQKPFWKRIKTQEKTKSDLGNGNQEIQKLLLSFKNESKWAVLTKWSTRVVSDHGTTILKVLEMFGEWKVNVPNKGFEICFKEYHDKFFQIGP